MADDIPTTKPTPSSSASPSLPSPPQTGRCQCPSNPVTYTITSPPQSLNVCYCTECQRQSGSAFALTLVVPSSGLVVSSDSMAQLHPFERKTESGRIRGGFFCSKCGVRIWHFDPARPEWVSIKAGTLDTKVDFRAAKHIWTKRKLVGVVIPEGVEAFEEEPDKGPV
ncbi:Mss4-like protein [Xylogone sp. PMI_703]|nr:Mss4-like protein [Xylogone sp. PMI_703]